MLVFQLCRRNSFLCQKSMSYINFKWSWGCQKAVQGGRRAGVKQETPYLYYTCPEGATAKMLCVQGGAALHPTDALKHTWFFTPNSDQHCSGRTGPRHIINSIHDHHSLPPGLRFGSAERSFWVVLENVTHADQGRYCCTVFDIQMDHKHFLVQRPHSHIILQITPSKNIKCMVYCVYLTHSLSVTPSGTVPVALAVAACVLALLFLPLILVLVYKQRQNTHEALGHENPVFLGESPQTKTRTVSQIMARQLSETGRHLLSEPGTPLSPPAHGDVFFPIEGKDTPHLLPRGTLQTEKGCSTCVPLRRCAPEEYSK
uniref:Uncharacterized protein n=1 Tax=Mola mola TaxID=94237 RepID=A0A3Q3W492_MOLML